MLLSGLACGLIVINLGSLGQAFLLTCLLEFSLCLIFDFKANESIICVIVVFLFFGFFEKSHKNYRRHFFSLHCGDTRFPFGPIITNHHRISSDFWENQSSSCNTFDFRWTYWHGKNSLIIRPGGAIKKDIISFYTQNGFRIYGNVFSHYFSTRGSISSLLIFDPRKEVNKSFRKRSSDGKNYEVAKNKYFQEIGALGIGSKFINLNMWGFARKTFESPLAIPTCRPRSILYRTFP